MLLKLKKPTDSPSMLTTWTKSKLITPIKLKPIPEVKTYSPILPKKNSKTSILKPNQTQRTIVSTYLSTALKKVYQAKSIGSLKVRSKKLKTKDNVDLAGLSPPLPPLNLLMLFSDLNSEEVKWTTEFNIYLKTESVPKHLILIRELTDNAKSPHAPNLVSQSKEFKISKLQSILSNRPVWKNQFPLDVMLQIGHHTPVVSSALVEHLLITEFYLLVIPLLIGSSKTHGVLLGENRVISDLLEMLILVVFVTLLVFQLDHQILNCSENN